MNVIEIEAKTKEQALEKASDQLNIPVYELKYELLEEDKGGLFGINKNVKLRIMYNHPSANKDIENMLLEILNKMSIRAELETSEENDNILIKMSSPEAGILIGKQGRTLQYIINIINSKDKKKSKKIVLDIESYRKKREITLRNLAKNTAKRVLDTGKEISLEPMNPYERRIIHMSLQDSRYVKTKSEGNGLFKKIKIFRNAN
jgi:spoIIIJ-associated protein